MKIIHISDTHGRHKNLLLPPGDVLIHSGDFSDYGIDVETHAFLSWFKEQPFKYKILVAGNHDEFMYESEGIEGLQFDLDGIHYLNESEVVIEGVKFYGSPRVPSDFSMAFTYYPEDANDVWKDLPADVDVLITHGPSKGFLDDGLGCKALRLKVDEMPNLKAHLFGHIHQAKGMLKKGSTFLSNAAESVNVIQISGLNMLDEINTSTWVISDTHFNHEKILSYEPSRVWSMTEQGFDSHNEWLIHNWNRTVAPNDLVLHLGDFSFKGSLEWLDQLNGRIVLLIGNHDIGMLEQLNIYMNHYPKKFYLVEGCDGVVDCENPGLSAFTKIMAGKKLLFSHYPVISEELYARGKVKDTIEVLCNHFVDTECDLNIHGHVHSHDQNTFHNEINVSLERTGFKPIRLGDVLSRVK
jgi:calcineurin-like phosphoesterase family protein